MIIPKDKLFVSYGFPFIASVIQTLLYDHLSSLSDDLFDLLIHTLIKTSRSILFFLIILLLKIQMKKQTIKHFILLIIDYSNYYSSSDIPWFDFSSIRQEDKSKWNVEIQGIDVEKEFTEDVMEAAREQFQFYSLLHQENNEEESNPERIGPNDFYDEDMKYIYDFTCVVNDILESNSLPCFDPGHKDSLSVSIPEFREFLGLFLEGTEYSYPVEIIYPSAYTHFLETPEDKRSLVLECFTKAFNKIDEYWRDNFTHL